MLGGAGVVVLHEIVHACGKCKGGGPTHTLPYNRAAQCIARVLKC